MNPQQQQILRTFFTKAGTALILSPDDVAHYMHKWTDNIKEDFEGVWDMNYLQLENDEVGHDMESWRFSPTALGKRVLQGLKGD